MSLPAYPKYKDSGVEWLGKVPEHWEVKRLRNLCEISKGRLPKSTSPAPVSDTDLPYLSMDFLRGESETPTYVPNSTDLLVADAGEILLLWDGSNAGEFLKAKRGVVSSTVALIEAKGVNTSFLFYSSKAIERKLKDTTIGMGIPHVSGDELRSFSISVPPSQEQSAIASFLDHETAKIDALVAEQQRLIELLKEKRQAVISHAVTKGLNSKAKLKPSGIEWLGEVPEHWCVTKLGRSCKLRSGFAFSAATFGQDGVVIIRMNNLKRGILDISEAARIPESACEPKAALAEGDLIWGMSGSTGETGSLGNFARVRLGDLPCQLNQRVGRFDANPSVLDLDFLEYVIQTAYFYEQVMLFVTGTAQFNVSSDQVQSCVTALPPLAEQTAIVAFLDAETAKFDTLTVEAQRAIDLLQERRSALISAAVTGQIDVRNFAPTKAA
jgi:type I restriction enzyme S subunit